MSMRLVACCVITTHSNTFLKGLGGLPLSNTPLSNHRKKRVLTHCKPKNIPPLNSIKKVVTLFFYFNITNILYNTYVVIPESIHIA